MAGFTAPPDNAEPAAGQMIEADGWFPGINTNAVRARIRIGDGAVTEARLAEAVIAAMLAGIKALAAWRSAHAEAGLAGLADVSDATLAGENMAEVIWRRILIYYAAAELMDTHTDVSATDDILDREDEKRLTADSYRRKAYEAVSDLRGLGPAGEPDLGRNVVELI
ncbi:head completion/stabilization protein [Erythrobacter sp. EC-HK427]|uniref:head completion/stabilization protein n=1 Tax=Erythrobacter sp. EC-HK427 TaxID=2038396 RepID=UPI0012584B14|nr:head completion/stabilization protein [Erythrobacter sp. EC-HK427]VVT07461.1 Phage head completion-stabilization protein [Erythrobacter sp. EC-HK427]